MPEQTNANDELLEKINLLLRRLFKLRREQQKHKRKYDEKVERLKTEYEAESTKLNAKTSEIKRKLRKLVANNRQNLAEGGKSFATMFGKFSYRNLPNKFKVTDKASALMVARKLGIVRRVADAKVVWTINPGKLEAYLTAHPEYEDKFEDCVYLPKDTPDESLSVKPNDAYLTRHDPKRLTDKPINLSSDD